MRSNPPFDPRIQQVGHYANNPSPIYMQPVMHPTAPPPQNFLQHQSAPQQHHVQQYQMYNTMPPNLSHSHQQTVPKQMQNQQARISRQQLNSFPPPEMQKPSSVPIQKQESHPHYQYQPHENQRQEEGNYQQQYQGEQQQVKYQQIIMFWEHKFFTILEKFQIMAEKIQRIRNQFYNLNDELKNVDSQEQWNDAKNHHEDFMEQLQQFTQQLAGVIHQNANLVEQNDNDHNQPNIWRQRYFQLFQGYKNMQQELAQARSYRSQQQDMHDPKFSELLQSYQQLQREYTQAANELAQYKQKKEKVHETSVDKAYRQKLQFALKQAESYKETLDQLHRQNEDMAGQIEQLKHEKHNMQIEINSYSQTNHQQNYEQFTRAINDRDEEINMLNKQLKDLSDKYNFLVQTHNSLQSRFQEDDLRLKNKINEFEQQADNKNMQILQLKAKLHESELKQKSTISISDEYQKLLKVRTNQLQQRNEEIQKLRKQITGILNTRKNDSERELAQARKQFETKIRRIEETYEQKIEAIKKKLHKKEEEIENTALLNIKIESLQKKNKMLLQEIENLTNDLSSKQKQSMELKRVTNVQERVKELQYQYNIVLEQKQRLNAALLQRNYDIEALQSQINQFQSRIKNLSENNHFSSSKPLMNQIEELTKLVQIKESQINKLRTTVGLKEGQIKELQNQMQKIKTTGITNQKLFTREKETLKQSIRNLERKSQQNQKRMRQLQFQYGSVMKKNLQEEIKLLRAQNQQKQDAIIKLQAQEVQFRSRISHYERVRASHGSDLDQLTNRIKQLETSKYEIIKKVENSYRDLKSKQRQNRQLIENAKILKEDITKLQSRINLNEKLIVEKEKVIEGLQGQLLVANSRLNYITEEHDHLRLKRRDETDLLTKQSEDLRRRIFQYQHLNGSRKQLKQRISTEMNKIQNQMIQQLREEKQFLKSQLATALQQIGSLPSFDKKSNSPKKVKANQGIDYIQKRLFDFNNRLDDIILKNKQLGGFRGFGSNIENSNNSNSRIDHRENEDQIKSLKGQIQQLRKYIAKLEVEAGENIRYGPKNQLISIQQEKSYNQRIQFYQKQTNELQSRIESLIKVNASLKERVDSLLKDGGNNSVISYYKSQLTVSQETIQTLQGKIRKVMDENRSLKSNNSETTTKMCRQYEDRIFECQNKIFNLQRKIIASDLQKSKIENERIDFQRNYNLSQTELQSLKYSSEKQVQSLKKNNKQISDQVAKLQNSIADLLQKVRMLESENSRLIQAVHSQQNIYLGNSRSLADSSRIQKNYM